ncbi:MAG: STAS domain-containing protein [Leptonema sp. (in: bacteria)]
MESFTKSKQDDVIIVKIKGGIQHSDTPNFEKELESIILEQNLYKIIVDLTNVNHISSSALGVLIAMERKLKRKNGDIRLVITEPEILKVMQITLLDRVFQIYNNSQDAIHSFKNLKQ